MPEQPFAPLIGLSLDPNDWGRGGARPASRARIMPDMIRHYKNLSVNALSSRSVRLLTDQK